MAEINKDRLERLNARQSRGRERAPAAPHLEDSAPAMNSQTPPVPPAATAKSFRADPHQLAAAYLAAKSFVLKAGFEAEIDYQEECSISRTGEPDFLREGAWVILSSGMRESVIRVKFPGVSDAFGHWRSAAWITQRITRCRRSALEVFGHMGKVEAIINLARRVHESGINEVLHQVSTQGIAYLRTFPFMGPATAYHFAKNLGLDVVKPDRHLVRISKAAGFETPWDLCNAIGEVVGEKRSVIDLVIWRYATIRHDYLETFAAAPAQCLSPETLLDERWKLNIAI